MDAVTPLDAIDRRVRQLVYTEVARAYGQPGHLTDPTVDNRCDCGHMVADHHTDPRGCSYCQCTVQDTL